MGDGGTPTCAYCGRPFEASGGVGRPRMYCRRSCRQRAFEQRRSGEDHAWFADRVRELSALVAGLEDQRDLVGDLIETLGEDVEDDRVGDLQQRLAAILAEARRRST